MHVRGRLLPNNVKSVAPTRQTPVLAAELIAELFFFTFLSSVRSAFWEVESGTKVSSV